MNKKSIDYYLTHTDELTELIQGLRDVKRKPSAAFLADALEAFCAQIVEMHKETA